MTAFTGPFHVTRAFSEATVMTVDGVGSAQFEGAVQFASAVTFNQAVSVAGAAVLGGALTVNGALSAAGTFVAGSAATFNRPVSAANTLVVGSAATFNGVVTAAANVDVSGRIRTASHPVMGVALVTVDMQVATAGAVEVAIPTDAHITDISYHLVSNEIGTAAADLQILIGTSADDNEYATLAVSGAAPSWMDLANARWTGVSGPALHGKAAGGVFVKTTAVSGAVTAKNALLGFHFVRTA